MSTSNRYRVKDRATDNWVELWVDRFFLTQDVAENIVGRTGPDVVEIAIQIAAFNLMKEMSKAGTVCFESGSEASRRWTQHLHEQKGFAACGILCSSAFVAGPIYSNLVVTPL